MIKFQQGSASGVLAIVILACLVLKIAASTVPAIIDDRLINTQIKEAILASNNSTSPKQFYDDLDRRFSMNNLYDKKSEELLKATQTGTGIRVVKNYEVRDKFILNIDFAMKFEGTFDKNSAAE